VENGLIAKQARQHGGVGPIFGTPKPSVAEAGGLAFSFI